MDGQVLFFGFATMFGGAALSLPVNDRRRRISLCVIGVVCLAIALSWPILKSAVGDELTRSINNLASNGWVWLGMLALSWIYLAFIKYPWTLIEILTPEMDQKVNREESVSGLVLPRDSFVQLFILAGDNLWHPITTRTDGAAWRATAKIGDKENPAKSHKLVAISGASQIKKPVPKLPRGDAVSRTIVVYRITGS